MLIGDTVCVLVEDKQVRGRIIEFTEKRVKISVAAGITVLRKRENVEIVENTKIYDAGDSESEESVCCGDYKEVCSRQPFCAQVVNFFYEEQRLPRRITRIKRDDIVIIDPDYSTPELEQIGWVLTSKNNTVTLYKGGSRTIKYDVTRLLKVRRSKLTDEIVKQYRVEARRNDIEVPERNLDLRNLTKKTVGHRISYRKNEYEW